MACGVRALLAGLCALLVALPPCDGRVLQRHGAGTRSLRSKDADGRRLLAKAAKFNQPKYNQAIVDAHYLKQGVRGGVGKYGNTVDACKNCLTYYPETKPGTSPDGVVHWEKTCYSGRCNFDVPWVGGPQDEQCGDGDWKCWYWGLQNMWCDNVMYGAAMNTICKKTCGRCDPSQDQTKYCFSLDPVEWYDECPALLWKQAATVMDVARVCEYDHQIEVMTNPKLWNGEWTPFLTFKIDGQNELNCESVIQDGGKLYDDTLWPDSRDVPLSLCCERVHQFFTCMGDKQELVDKDAEGLQFLDSMSYGIVKSFSSYCVPLFQHPTQPEFCKAFPKSDPCIQYFACDTCTSHGGIWCANHKKCTLDKETSCGANYETPDQCPPTGPPKPPITATTATTTTTAVGFTTTTPERVPHWWWKLVHQGHVYSEHYYPDPTIGVKQGDPPIFHPFHERSHPLPKRHNH